MWINTTLLIEGLIIKEYPLSPREVKSATEIKILIEHFVVLWNYSNIPSEEYTSSDSPENFAKQWWYLERTCSTEY